MTDTTENVAPVWTPPTEETIRGIVIARDALSAWAMDDWLDKTFGKEPSHDKRCAVLALQFANLHLDEKEREYRKLFNERNAS